MSNRNIVVIGTSAGGVEALRFLASKFPRDLPASVLVTIHLASNFRSELDEILNRDGPLRAAFVQGGERMQKGRIYLAPPEHHLILDEDDRLSLGVGPRENGSRPAIDPMFRSTAACCGGRAVGVVMTGTLGDGASGLWAIRQGGGITVVQDPERRCISGDAGDGTHPGRAGSRRAACGPAGIARKAGGGTCRQYQAGLRPGQIRDRGGQRADVPT